MCTSMDNIHSRSHVETKNFEICIYTINNVQQIDR